MKTTHKLAGHFILIPELLYSPPNDAIISAYMENGYTVDVYSPGRLPKVTSYGNRVNTFNVSYSWFWIIKNIVRAKWLRYDCFSGTSEDPLAIVGLLGFFYRRKSFCLVDEIKSGSYRGDRSEKWKDLCRWSIRRASFSIVNDVSRINLLEEYATMRDREEIQVYPGCFKDPPKKNCEERKKIRAQWGFTDRDFVIGSSGGFNMTSGADLLIRAIGEINDLRAVIQPLGVSPLSMFLLQSMPFRERVYIETDRLEWRDAWLSSQGLDVGLCIYTNQAPQFQNMGVSSNRLCMFLAMGIPVIASRQKSFDFIEKYNCGVLVSSYDEFIKAISLLRVNHRKMVDNCQICLEDYIRPNQQYRALTERIYKLGKGQG